MKFNTYKLCALFLILVSCGYPAQNGSVKSTPVATNKIQLNLICDNKIEGTKDPQMRSANGKYLYETFALKFQSGKLLFIPNKINANSEVELSESTQDSCIITGK